ncbi:MAG: sodium/solute symporter [Pseudomonadota bacterium]
MELTSLDLIIVVVTLIAVLAGGVVAGRNVRDADGYCLGSRQAPWWVVGLSVFATYVSALSFLGAPGWAYDDGLRTLMLQANFPLVALIVARVFVPMFYELRVASVYEYHRGRFGTATSALSSGLYLLTQALSSAGILYTSALVLGEVLNLPFVTALLGVGLLTLLYSAGGGMNSVLWTDVVQSVVLAIGLLLVLFFAIRDFVTMDVLADAADSAQVRADRNRILFFEFDLKDKYTIWAGLLAMTLYRVQAQGASQFVIQRTLAARNVVDAQRSLLILGYSVVPMLAAMLGIGACLYLTYEGRSFDNSNTIILQYISDLAVPGLAGILIAALFAASMSSLDSSLNSLSTVTFHGFLKKRFELSPVQSLRSLRLLSAFWLAVLLLPAYLFSRGKGSILERVVEIGGYFAGAELALFCLGFFAVSIGQAHVLFGVATGFVGVFSVATLTEVSWPWFCAVGFLGTFAGAFASRLASGPVSLTAEQSGFLYHSLGRTTRVTGLRGSEWGLVAFLLIWLGLLALLERSLWGFSA